MTLGHIRLDRTLNLPGNFAAQGRQRGFGKHYGRRACGESLRNRRVVLVLM
jgi:hypothetical protein